VNYLAFSPDRPYATAWSQDTTKELVQELQFIAPDLADLVADIRIQITLPITKDYLNAHDDNTNLLGNLTLHWPQVSDKQICIDLFLPYCGVFVVRNDNASTPSLYTWSAWLSEKPGARYMRKPGSSKAVFWRLGLYGGSYIEHCFSKDKTIVATRPKRPNSIYLSHRGSYPSWVEDEIRSVTKSANIIGLTKKGQLQQAATNLNNGFIDLWKPKETTTSDADDLRFLGVQSHPIWLRDRVIGLTINMINSHLSTLSGNIQDNIDPLHEALSETWLRHATSSTGLYSSIFPAARLIKSGSLQPLLSRNPVEFCSSLNKVRRSSIKGEFGKRLPAAFRQNHPSFFNKLCPFESPESTTVGLQFRLAKDATIDADGSIQVKKTAPDSMLGVAVAQIPFSNHNDGARNMMGGKNLRQATQIAGADRAIVATGNEGIIRNLARPLLEIQSASGKTPWRNMGRDMLVAYLPWFGWNVDDAIVVSQEIVDAGFFDTIVEKSHRRLLKPGWTPHSFEADPFGGKLIDGLAVPNSHLNPGDFIATFGREAGGSMDRFAILYREPVPARLASIEFSRSSENLGGILKYSIETLMPLAVGDKMMGRHGNKGVIGKIIPQEEMPHLPNTPALPETMRGKPVQILLNPHGVISRMNIGQLLETHVGWLLTNGIQPAELLRDGVSTDSIGQAFSNQLDHAKVKNALLRTGLDEFGRSKLILPGDSPTAYPVVIGHQHFVRLKHIPSLKSQARRGGPDAPYSLITGQPVGGRKRGGGQRLGEMEIWALSAHGADEILKEMLGVKSSKFATQNGKRDSGLATGYGHFLRSWLNALMIDLAKTTSSMEFSFLDPEIHPDKINSDNEIESATTTQSAVKCHFTCSSRSKKTSCDFNLGALGDIRTSIRGNSESTTLQFDDFLRHIGYDINSPLSQDGGDLFIELSRLGTQEMSGRLMIEVELKNEQFKAIVRPCEILTPKGWPRSLECVALYSRCSRPKSEQEDNLSKNYTALELHDMFQDETGNRSIGQCLLACPHHRTSTLKSITMRSVSTSPVPGGLYDEGTFGRFNSAAKSAHDQWGSIKLPFPIRYPIEAFLPVKTDPDDFLARLGLTEECLPVLESIPILPIRYRMPNRINGRSVPDRITEEGYLPLVQSCLLVGKADKDHGKKAAKKRCQAALVKLFRLLASNLDGKKGYIRRNGLGRRLDRTARLVITPNPDLEWHQCGVPTAVMLELMGDELEAWAKENRDSHTDLGDALCSLPASYAESIGKWRWRDAKHRAEVLDAGHKILELFLASQPDFIVLLNRQPSLHKHSFQAFHPVPVPPGEGDTLQISPLCCAGFGADFDGDEMVVHFLGSKEARAEARSLLPAMNMISDANGQPTANYDQDHVLGTYFATVTDRHQEFGFWGFLPEACCRALLSDAPLSKGKGLELLQHICTEHKEEAPRLITHWMRAAYERCSQLGTSFGFYELMALSTDLSGAVDHLFATCRDKARLNDELQNAVNARFNEVTKSNPYFNFPGASFVAMAMSGARGQKQTRQLIAARGQLLPGDQCCTTSAERFVFRENLIEGMCPNTAFFAAMNSRSSMCDKKLGTPQAGYLTRKLVFALWPVKLVAADCGLSDEIASIELCEARDGICARCYNRSTGEAPRVAGFPAGLIAAQSIGERSTQLSMQSFHTGDRQVSLKGVLDVLEGRDQQGLFDGPASSIEFLKFMKGIPAYKSVTPHHLLVLWRAIANSKDRSIRSAALGNGVFADIGLSEQSRSILKAALSGSSASPEDVFSRVLFNLPSLI